LKRDTRETTKLYRDTNIKDNGTPQVELEHIGTVPIVTNFQALGGHWKVVEEDGKVTLYFKQRIISLEPYGGHYHDPKSKEEFKKEGESWYLKIPYHGWVNLDNVFCFYE